MSKSANPFLQRLQQEAAQQAKLNQVRLLPTQIDGITSLIGRYPWQCLLVVSGVTAVGLELAQVL